MAKTANIDLSGHALVPQHEKLKDSEKKELLEKYNIKEQKLPLIFANDPAISSIDAKEGDIIKITRKSPTAGEAVFYRCVTNG